MISAINPLLALALYSQNPLHSNADGSEVVGNYLEIDFGKSRNRLTLLSSNKATIGGENGVISYASWSTRSGKLCLQLENGAKECWPYRTAFKPGQTMRLVSDCGVASSWTLRLVIH